VLQTQLDPDVAGVLFTCNPIGGADERVIEASWGLGEAVVAGLVTPDRFRMSRSGVVLERLLGRKESVVRPAENGGTEERPLPAELSSRSCLEDGQLADLHRLADRCERVFGERRDIEWAIVGEGLYLLQCRPLTC
jgi:pyruvate, water dikinase